MLDNRLQTFLVLCEMESYTKTAEKLNMTQPAVSQHIQYLENHYGVDLILEKRKNFSLTEEGKALRNCIRELSAHSDRIHPLLHRIQHQKRHLQFGATLTIGEYTIPPILHQIFKKDPDINISMFVENTQLLGEMLWDGKIDFALIEGHFNQSQFDCKLISHESLIGVCSPDNPIASKVNDIHDLLSQNLILREVGSGTRDIFEQALYNQNLTILDFNRKIEIGNMNAIKELCHQNIGITFMYEEAVKKEISSGYLKKIPIQNFHITHPFYFVYLKHTPDKLQIETWYDQIIQCRVG